MKPRRGKVRLTVVTILALALGLGVWAIHYRAKRALANYKEQLVAAGERLTVQELIPEPVTPDQNSADIFLRAATLMNKPPSLLDTNPPPAMRMVATGKAMIGFAQPHIRNYDNRKATNTWSETEEAIAGLSGAMELLQRIIDHPARDFRLNYEQGFSLPLPNLAGTKRAAQRLSAAALCDLHRGDDASATMNVRAMLALAKGSADERLVISQLVRMAIAAITFTVNWELLQSPGLTEAQLASLQRDWSDLEFIQTTEYALAMERAMSEMTVAQMRNSSTEFKKVVSGYAWGAGSGLGSTSSDDWFEQAEQFVKDSWDKTRMKVNETAWRVAWSYPDQLRKLKGDQVLLETARLVRSNGCFNEALRLQQTRLDALGIRRRTDDDASNMFAAGLDLRFLLSQSVVSLDRVLKRVMAIEVSRQMVITAIALKRYQLRHGIYPSDLAALVPEFLPAVSRDPVDGQPLRYRANTDGTFTLYSVGEDGEDQGGNPKPADEKSESRQWQRGRDWVWPQPATAEEVEACFESLRKKRQP